MFLFVILSSCQNNNLEIKKTKSLNNQTQLICKNAERFQGQVIGDGHCVTLIKLCSNSPNTKQWRAGKKVFGADLASGTVIATFKNDRYPSKTGYHAAIYIDQDKDGIWVWDQWVGKPVHKRLIRWRQYGPASNNGNEYKVVKLTN